MRSRCGVSILLFLNRACFAISEFAEFLGHTLAETHPCLASAGRQLGRAIVAKPRLHATPATVY